MKAIIAMLLFTTLCIEVNAQSLIGAWENHHTAKSGEQLKSVSIYTDAYQVTTTYHAETGKFISCKGGSWRLAGNILTEIIEFNTDEAELVGTTLKSKVLISDKNLKIDHIEFTRIDDGKPGKLQGAWLMSGRVRDGEKQIRNTNLPRKTMKIMSGTRFQWIAYDTAKKQFMGTGGGTYSTINGKYTENIEFFSKDDTRVGASLEFNYKVEGEDWIHTGLSSKGDPIHEIWSVRK